MTAKQTTTGKLTMGVALLALMGCLEGEMNRPAIVFFSPDAAAPPMDGASMPVATAVDGGMTAPVGDDAANPATAPADASMTPSDPQDSDGSMEVPRDVPPGDCRGGRWTLDINGSQRAVKVDIPQNWSGGPLLLVLHGNGDSADNFCRSTGICADGVARGALVATPDGPVREIQVYNQRLRVAWNAYQPDANQNEDLALLDAIANEARTQCGTRGSYVWGHSQGGYLAYLYAQVRGENVWGAVISAAANPTPGRPWAATPPRPFYLLIGDQDPALPNARQSAAELQQSGHRVNLNVLPGVGHGGHPRGYNAAIMDFIWP